MTDYDYVTPIVIIIIIIIIIIKHHHHPLPSRDFVPCLNNHVSLRIHFGERRLLRLPTKINKRSQLRSFDSLRKISSSNNFKF